MKIAIVGAGAIGGWLGARLAKQGHEISALARGETLATLQSAGWRLEIDGCELQTSVRASQSAAELGVQDIVLITLKGPALSNVAPTITPLLGQDSLILPMMNGVPWWFLLGGGGQIGASELKSVDPDGAIAAALPFDQIIGSVVHASVEAIGPGRVKHKAGNRLIFGEPLGGLSERLHQLGSLFSDAGFAVELTENVRYEIWYKLWGNMTMNPISALTGATCDRLLDDDLVSAFVLRVMAEAQEIGRKIGCSIAERGEDRNAVTRQLGAFKTSMLQDAEAGRPLEIDQILSAPRDIAKLIGCETPNLDALTGLTRLFARSNDLYPAA